MLTFCGRIPGELELEILGPDSSLNSMLCHDSDYCVHSFESDRLVRAVSEMDNFDFRCVFKNYRLMLANIHALFNSSV